MGKIRKEIEEYYLSNYPEEKDLLIPFLNGFYVTYAEKKEIYNTSLSVFFLSPEDHFKESYGFQNEVLLIYSPYKTMQPRTLQAVEKIFSLDPAKGRVETLSYFLITNSEEIIEFLKLQQFSDELKRVIVPFKKDDLIKASKGDNWFVRKKINKHFFERDLFDFTLPIVEDGNFFGRQKMTMTFYD